MKFNLPSNLSLIWFCLSCNQVTGKHSHALGTTLQELLCGHRVRPPRVVTMWAQGRRTMSSCSASENQMAGPQGAEASRGAP